jgi:tetratricopeptide (TPR) repeat protein
MGWAAQAQAGYAAAREYYQQSRDLFWQIGERGTTASQIRRLGDVALAEGDYAAAEQHYQDALALWRALDNPLGIAMAIRCLGKVAYRQRAYDQAIRFYEESLALFRTTASQYDVARVLIGLARALTRRGDHVRSRELFAESLSIACAIDRPSAIIGALEGLAGLAQACANSNGAALLLAVAERIREEHSIHRWPADRPEYDTLAGEVQAALGEAAFAQAWADGRALTLDQAIAEGLSSAPNN